MYHPMAQKIQTQGGIDKMEFVFLLGFSFSKGEGFRFMRLVRGCIFSHNLTCLGSGLKNQIAAPHSAPKEAASKLISGKFFSGRIFNSWLNYVSPV